MPVLQEDTDGARAAAIENLPPPREAALFLDIDGTLFDIAAHPFDVRADEWLLRVLSGVGRATRGAVAFVSGRAIADIDRIFAPLVFSAAGLHGAEMRLPDGSTSYTSSDILDTARPALAQLAAQHPGLFLEDKGATIAMHYRARPELEGEVLERMSALVTDMVTVLRGKCVVELKPVLYDKGGAIARFLEMSPFRGRTPVFIGDDYTDEAGFAVVNDAGGLSIRIDDGVRGTKARMRISTPGALRALLAEFVTPEPERRS